MLTFAGVRDKFPQARILSYDPDARHAQVLAATDDELKARAFSYYFALRHIVVFCTSFFGSATAGA